MNDPVLTALGLTVEQVREVFNVPEPGEHKKEYLNYLFAGDQRRMRRRMKNYHGFIVARFLEGYSPRSIAWMLAVSEESVRSRLRKAKMFRNPAGRPGRPKNGSTNRFCWSGPQRALGRARPASKVYSDLCPA